MSQIYVSAAGSYNTYSLNEKKSTPAIQLKGGYNIRPKVSAFLGYSYVLPVKTKDAISVGDTSINTEITHSFQNLTFGVNWHLIGRTNSAVSFYLPFSASYVLYNMKAKGDMVNQSEKEGDFTVNLGLGLHARVGGMYLFGEAVAAIPRGEYNTRDGAVGPENPIPFHNYITFGVRIPFGDEEGGGGGGKRNKFNREDIF